MVINCLSLWNICHYSLQLVCIIYIKSLYVLFTVFPKNCVRRLTKSNMTSTLEQNSFLVNLEHDSWISLQLLEMGLCPLLLTHNSRVFSQDHAVQVHSHLCFLTLIISSNCFLMWGLFESENQPWLWHKFAHAWLFPNACVFFYHSLYHSQITACVNNAISQ